MPSYYFRDDCPCVVTRMCSPYLSPRRGALRARSMLRCTDVLRRRRSPPPAAPFFFAGDRQGLPPRAVYPAPPASDTLTIGYWDSALGGGVTPLAMPAPRFC